VTTKAVSATRAVWLLTKLRFVRLGNMLTAMSSRRLGSTAKRTGEAPKKRSRGLISGLVACFMLLIYGSLTRQSLISLHFYLDHPRRYVPHLPSGVMSEAMTRGVMLEISLLLLAATLGTLASRELTHSDWDLEWLTTLPVRPLNLQVARVLERAATSPYALLMFIPVATVVAWASGYGWFSPLAGMLAAIPMLLLIAMLRTLVDTGLRLSLSPAKLRNLSALLSIVSVLTLYSVISLGLPKPLEIMIDWARHFPGWARWLPPGLMITALNAREPAAQFFSAALLCAEVFGFLILGFGLLSYQLRNGVVSTGARELGRRAPPPVRTPELNIDDKKRFFSTVQRRELKLLSRDRSFMVQTLVLPVVIVVSQIVFQGRLHGSGLGGASNSAVAAIAFALAAYTLMMSAFQTLNAEGGSLWLLFTVPKSLQSVLAEKAKLWAVLALAYPAFVFVLASALRGYLDPQLLGLAAVVLIGVPIYSAIAVALGVFGSDPQSQDARTRLRPTYVYMYFALSGIYTYAIFASQWWQKLVLMVLSALLAAALWQKARDELPYLLDPAASPPAHVSTSDGLIAAMVFFVVQGIFAAAGMQGSHELSAAALTVAYAIAGAFTYLLFRYIYWRTKTQGVPRVFGRELLAAAGGGLLAGGAAVIIGVTYLYLAKRFDFGAEQLTESAKFLSGSRWLPLLAVLAAPIFEEFIFRGLIFGGLRRSAGLWPSVLGSAAVFAVVHPPLSMIPVFGLGICAALAYERSKLLLAPMLTHALYNGVIIFWQLR
jgi:ABC-2 type transport system permease protein